MTSRELLLNAFTPAMEIVDPHMFAGRALQVRQLTDALLTRGSIPIIYGDRGLGKSSLAVQMLRISMGDTTLLAELGLEDVMAPEEQMYAPFYLPCTDAVTNLRDVLTRLVTELQLGYSEMATADSLEASEISNTARLGVSVFSYQTVKRYTLKATATRSFDGLDPEDQVLRMLHSIREVSGLKVLVVIDEIDRVGTTRGLASFLKSVSSEHVKFLVVGVGNDVSELMTDHQSLDRMAVPVLVRQMSPSELADIVNRAMRYLSINGLPGSFSVAAKKYLVDLAGGFPWFAHVIGQAALLIAAEDSEAGSVRVERSHLKDAVQQLAGNRYAQRFGDMYQEAVRDSPAREYLLRALAAWRAQDIPTSEIYPHVRALDVSSPSVYLGHLLQDKYGSILVRPPNHSRGVVRFRNEMFKVYVRARPSIFVGVDEADS